MCETSVTFKPLGTTRTHTRYVGRSHAMQASTLHPLMDKRAHMTWACMQVRELQCVKHALVRHTYAKMRVALRAALYSNLTHTQHTPPSHTHLRQPSHHGLQGQPRQLSLEGRHCLRVQLSVSQQCTQGCGPPGTNALHGYSDGADLTDKGTWQQKMGCWPKFQERRSATTPTMIPPLVSFHGLHRSAGYP